MAARTDIEYNIVCRRDIQGQPWQLLARNENGFSELQLYNTRPSGKSIQEFMEMVDGRFDT